MIGDQDDADAFYRLSGQWAAFQGEIETLSAKKPDGLMNAFKLKMANQLIVEANGFLEEERLPIVGFESFEEGDTPTYSDALVVLSQYRRALRLLYEDFSDVRKIDGNRIRVWYINDEWSEVEARMDSHFKEHND